MTSGTNNNSNEPTMKPSTNSNGRGFARVAPKLKRSWAFAPFRRLCADVIARLLGGKKVDGGGWDPCASIYDEALRRALRAICILLPLAPFGVWKLGDLIADLIDRLLP